MRAHVVDKESKAAFIQLKRDYFNQSLSDFVKNKNSLAIIEYKNQLFQKMEPIYQEPETNFVFAHFYSPHKKLFGLKISTFWMNLMVLWTLSIFLYLTLYFNLFKRFMESLEKLSDKYFNKE